MLLSARKRIICTSLEFSIESLSQNGFKLSNICLDLHNSDFEGNIVTEYEERFSEQGFRFIDWKQESIGFRSEVKTFG